jgi:transcriptional regulator GlxA family with amidase domain
MQTAPSPRKVLMLAFAECQILDVTGPLEILASANELDRAAPAPYAIELVAEAAGQLTTTSGLKLVADRGFGDLTAADLNRVHTFMVAGGDGTVAALKNAALIDFVKRAAEAAPRVASVCSGSVILAAAGLLDGRRATTHWNTTARMARAFPNVRVEPDAIYVRDGKFWTSAGITAGMDLAIALLEDDLGREAALSVARRHVLYMMRPGGQSQFSAELKAQGAQGGRTSKAVRHVSAHLDGDLRLPALAAAAGLSERSLLRAFHEELQTTPAEFVQRARLDAARRRLSDGHDGVERIAAACGFGSAEVMRRTFQRELGISPAEYRARFATARRTRHDSTSEDRPASVPGPHPA